MQPEKLVMMTNQIAKFFVAQGEDGAAAQVANHINQFWDPRMRKRIKEHYDEGGAGLDPVAKAAVAQIKR